MGSIQYLHSDAWILLAIILSGGDRGADIADLISTADYINHAILCYEELDGALMRLILGNYIFEQNARFYPSVKILERTEEMPPRGNSESIPPLKIFQNGSERKHGAKAPIPIWRMNFIRMETWIAIRSRAPFKATSAEIQCRIHKAGRQPAKITVPPRTPSNRGHCVSRAAAPDGRAPATHPRWAARRA